MTHRITLPSEFLYKSLHIVAYGEELREGREKLRGEESTEHPRVYLSPNSYILPPIAAELQHNRYLYNLFKTVGGLPGHDYKPTE